MEGSEVQTESSGVQKGTCSRLPAVLLEQLYLEEIWKALPEYAGGLSEELAVVFAELDKFEGQ